MAKLSLQASLTCLLYLAILFTATNASPLLPGLFGNSQPTYTSVKAAATTTTTSKSTASPTFAATSTKIRGVNLGGWFILEQWMSPTLFQQAQSLGPAGAPVPADQWSVMTTINNTQKATQFLKNHWSSWLVESDFQQIKKIGLNTVRLPVPHWTFNSSADEPYLGGGAELPYISQAILWASKYGLDVMLDMHTAPNSQNGFDSSGHIGSTGFKDTNGPLNAARLNSALVSMTKTFVNDPKYNGAVKYIEVLNEPLCSSLGADYMTYIYQNAASVINGAIATNARSKPQIILHDCFISPLSSWSPAVSSGGGLQNVAFALDTHRYHVFAPRDNMSLQQHIDLTHADGDEIAQATNTLKRQVITGEFSLALSCTDCPTGVSSTTSAADIAKLNRQFFETQTTAYERGAGWIFWSWKAENNLPWSYKDALSANWIPSNPAEKSLAL